MHIECNGWVQLYMEILKLLEPIEQERLTFNL